LYILKIRLWVIIKDMRQLIWYGQESVKVEHLLEARTHLSEDQVLVKIKAVGICGTDIHIMKGGFPEINPPMILGHEIAGRIVETGCNVQRVRPGDRVTIDSVVGCGQCDLCRQGRYQFCADGFEFGVNRDGACQDYLIVPERNVYCVPDFISFEEAAVLDIEVWNALRKCGIYRDDRVLILGGGPIGIIACQLARVLGAQHITLSDILQTRLATANALGVADEYIANRQDDSTNEVASKPAYDVVLDCAGTSASTLYALKAVRPCGRVLLYGIHEFPVKQMDINQIILKDLVIFGALSDRTGWEDVIALVASGALDLKSLITHRFSLEDGSRAYEAVRRREDGLIKAVLLV
jgi:2-desacetyl-2-hydroxyethyl bacteriochlorophyllide A dehydrogenase